MSDDSPSRSPSPPPRAPISFYEFEDLYRRGTQGGDYHVPSSGAADGGLAPGDVNNVPLSSLPGPDAPSEHDMLNPLLSNCATEDPLSCMVSMSESLNQYPPASFQDNNGLPPSSNVFAAPPPDNDNGMALDPAYDGAQLRPEYVLQPLNFLSVVASTPGPGAQFPPGYGLHPSDAPSVAAPPPGNDNRAPQSLSPFGRSPLQNDGHELESNGTLQTAYHVHANTGAALEEGDDSNVPVASNPPRSSRFGTYQGHFQSRREALGHIRRPRWTVGQKRQKRQKKASSRDHELALDDEGSEDVPDEASEEEPSKESHGEDEYANDHRLVGDVERIFDAMSSLDNYKDTKTGKQQRQWIDFNSNTVFKPKDVEASAWEVVDEAIKLDRDGCTLRSWRDRTADKGGAKVATKESDRNLTYAERITELCTTFKEWKSACLEVLHGEAAVVVAGPQSTRDLKEKNYQGNKDASNKKKRVTKEDEEKKKELEKVNASSTQESATPGAPQVPNMVSGRQKRSRPHSARQQARRQHVPRQDPPRQHGTATPGSVASRPAVDRHSLGVELHRPSHMPAPPIHDPNGLFTVPQAVIPSTHSSQFGAGRSANNLFRPATGTVLGETFHTGAVNHPMQGRYPSMGTQFPQHSHAYAEANRTNARNDIEQLLSERRAGIMPHTGRRGGVAPVNFGLTVNEFLPSESESEGHDEPLPKKAKHNHHHHHGR